MEYPQDLHQVPHGQIWKPYFITSGGRLGLRRLLLAIPLAGGLEKSQAIPDPLLRS
jgi:hypothetical protein